MNIIMNRRSLSRFGCIAALAVMSTVASLAESSHTLIAGQSDYSRKQGYYLSFANDSTYGTLSLSTLKLLLLAADGTHWSTLCASGPFVFNHEYKVVGTIGGGHESLVVDGGNALQTEAVLAPCSLDLSIDNWWARGDADYQIIIDRVIVQSGGQTVDRDLRPPASLPFALQQIDRESLQRLATPRLDLSTGSVCITAWLHIVTTSSIKSAWPLIDQYGQMIAAKFPGKVITDSDLDAEAAKESARLDRIGVPKNFDKYGGRTDLGWTSKATGYFRVEKRNGIWWLITPIGNPCFYTGICSIPAVFWPSTPVTGRESLYSWLPDKDGRFHDAWGQSDGVSRFSFRAANLIRKFSGDWRAKETALSAKRLRTLGFSGVAKWGQLNDIASFPVLHIDAPKLLRHSDIFDVAVGQKISQSLSSQITPQLSDPNVVGWSIGNEVDEIIKPEEIADILSRDGGTAAKRALVDHALASIYEGNMAKLSSSWHIAASSPADIYASQKLQPPQADVEALRQYFADVYYGFLYDAVKKIDANHLYFGFWFPADLPNIESSWALMLRHVDVIGYDRYEYCANGIADSDFAKLLASTGKPAFCGEFGYTLDYDGTRGFCFSRNNPIHTEKQEGQAYERWIRSAASNAYIVGGGWFKYNDQPITGQGGAHGPNFLIESENAAWGIYTDQDQPRWTLFDHMRKANLAAANIRAAVTGPR
ncbi:MAG: hypothetical protein P4L33_13085 [Capsulimonadaceae bacterium]|nr:hypothetical protein [Capsulimonadaceae bacterium]